MKNKEIFFKDETLPYIECRYSNNSSKHYKKHLHDTFSIGAINKGKVSYTVGNEKALLKKDELAIIPAHTLHSCNPVNCDKRSYYMLYIDMKFLSNFHSALFDNDDFVQIDTIHLQDKSIYKEYIQMMDLFFQDNFLLEKEQRFIEFLEKLFLRITPKNLKAKTLSKDISLAKEMLSNNLEDEITLSQISKTLSLNPYTLIRNFKKEIGITPFSFRLNLKIELSKKLLQEGLDISEVALKCGFYDQSHFQKQFKAVVLITPKEYQENFYA